MAQDNGRLGVDVTAAQAAMSEVFGALVARRSAVEAAEPRRPAASYGRGLADRATRLVELRNRAHAVRLAHIDRLRQGLENAEATVAAVSVTEQDSRRGLRAGEVR